MKRGFPMSGNIENNLEAAPAAEQNLAAFTEDYALPNTDDVATRIQEARKQEKEKLYPQLEKMREELSLLRKREEERLATEAEKAEKRRQRDAEREAERRAKAEEEMSVKELLKTKEQEWQAKLEQERQERETAFAMLQKEREYNELKDYRNQRIEQERDNIMPELLHMVNGNTQDEIEQSIIRLKATTAQIVENISASQASSRKDMVVARITAPASGPLDTNSDPLTYSPDAIKNMSQEEYAKNRGKLLGNATNRGQGLFG
jgi:hypothetical protein